MLELIEAFRARGRFVVVGGPYASLCPEELRGRCDVLFVDEAEETWPEFLRDFAAGAWQAEYRPAEKPDLTTSPMPRFDLLHGRSLSRAHHPVRARLPVQLRVLRHHRGLRPPAARQDASRR